MQTSSEVDTLFVGLQQLREKPQEWRDSLVGKAVIATCTQATEQYLTHQDHCRVCFSVGDLELRTISVMEEIRKELGELFGIPNVSVHRSDSYHLGIVIFVRL